jgi:2-dehydropantoate 2-reductase
MPDNASKPMHILSFGAGAIGTYIGGSLALDGHAVTFLERPAIVAELRQRGLHLKLLEREGTILKPTMAASLEEALAQGPFDVGLFALKSYDTQAALASFGPNSSALPPILCLQNGVENETQLAEALGEDRVIPATVTSAIGRNAAGDIVLERLRGVGIADGHPLSQRLVEAFSKAGLNARLYNSAAAMKWSKMLTNLLANATSAILDMTPSQIFAHPGVYQLEVQQLREALRVMAAQNIDAVDLPGTPVRALAFAVRGLPPGVSRPLLRNAVGSGRGGKMPSFHIDLNSGRGQTEVDALNGAVVRFGERLGVATPVNRLLSRTLQELARGEIPRDAFSHNPEKLLKGLKER